MKITLKNIDVNLKFSEETTMFCADIYIDGVKVGYAENRGCGGATDIEAIGDGDKLWKNRKLLQSADEYCRKLPDRAYEYERNGETKKLVYGLNLENFIDDLISDHLEQKETKRFQNKLAKDLEKYICISKTSNKHKCENYERVKFKTYFSINEIFSNPNLKQKVLDHINEKEKEGFFVLNNNLPI